MPTMIDVEKAVRRLAYRYPSRYYKTKPGGSCSYLPDDANPMGCIIGAALRQVVPFVNLSEHEGRAAAEVVASHTDEYSPAIAAWLDKVQTCQDSGFSWSESVESVDGRMG